MRKLLPTLRSALLLLLLVGTVQIALGNFDRYDSFYHAGIYYRIVEDGIVSVDKPFYYYDNYYQGDIVIPSRVTASVSNYGEDYSLSYVVTGIAPDAFKNCIGLTSIELPNTVKSIGDNAFYGCSGLSSITLSNGLESIGQSAFGNCTSLKSITIPNSVSSMGWNVFYGCSDLKNVTLSNHLRELNGTFVGCSSLESIKIPTSVVSLNGSFTNCTSLNTVAIPYSVSSIGEKAFYGCSGLVSVNIPNSVSQIGKLAFSNTALIVVDIPNTVTSIGQDAFQGCNQLTTVTSRAVEPPTMSNKNTFEAWVYENAKLKVPQIAESTYRERNWWNLFNDIIGNESLNNNYDFVVDGIYYLKVDENSVEVTYKDNNYNSYSGIVNVPASVTSGGKTYSVVGVGNYAFYNCSSLTGVSLPATITTIGSNAFANAGISAINLPDAVTTIATRAFYGCSKLSSLTVPENVSSIGKEAFAVGNWLTQLTWNAKHCWSNGDITTTNINKVIIGNTVEVLPINFVAQAKIATINIPASVSYIGSYAFRGCSSISNITIPKSVMNIGKDAFIDCTGLTKLTWKAKNCNTNGSMCTDNITEVTVGNDVETLPIGFLRNSKITSINIPNSVKVIGGIAFSGCRELSNLSLPESIQVIGDFAFYGCSALTALTIPRSVISIGYYAFDYCDGLSSLTWNAINCTTNGDMTTYNLSQVNIGNEVKKLPIGLAANSQITSISIPNSVDSICSRAFEECESLLNVDIPNSVIYIGDYVFKGCIGLTDVTIPDQVTNIGNSAFYGCIGLTNVIIPDQVTNIDNSAFYGCTGLTKITIGASVESIGGSAFSGCTSLQTVISLPLIPPYIYYSFYGVPDDMTVYVLPDALEAYQSDYYWSRFNIQTADFNVSNLTVNLPGGADVSKYANMKLEIKCKDSNKERHLVIDKKASYTFGALDNNTSWNIAVANQYGDVFGTIENVEIGEQDVTVTFPSLKQPQTVSLMVKTPDGQDVTEQVNISWLDESGELLKQGKQIFGLPSGRRLAYSVKLPQEMATAYSLPANRTYTVKEGTNNPTCQLTALSQVQLRGKVKDAKTNQSLYGASISATQMFTGGDPKTLTTQSNRQGFYLLDALNVPTVLTFAATGYVSQTLNYDEIVAEDNNFTVPEIALNPYEGVVLNIHMTYTPAHVEGNDTVTQNWYSDYDNVDFEIYNKTTNHLITDVNVSYPKIVIMEDVNDGDVLEMTAMSRNDAFQPVKTNVTIVGQKATATFNIAERGKIAVTYKWNINPRVVGTLYSKNGYLKRIGEYTNGSLSFDNLDEGEYTLITMGESGAFNTIYSMEQFEAIGLQEGLDFVENDITVNNGFISNVIIDKVPFFEPDGFVTDNTSFTVTKPNLVIGNFQTFRAQVFLKEQYADIVNDVTLIVDFPENCKFMENSVQIGSSIAEYSVQGNRILIPMSNTSAVVRLCAIPTESGEFNPSAFVQFNYLGEIITVPIGNANFTADALSISVPPTAANISIPVSGTAIGQCSIEIYDNDVLIGQTTSLANGIWSSTCDLYEPYNMSWHNIHAMVTTSEGLTLSTESASCLYDMDGIQVKKVKMYHYNPSTLQTYEVEYDFQNPTNESQSWVVYYPKKVFTFTIDFTNNSPEILSNIVLHVHTADGRYLSYYPEYDPEQDLWVVNCDLGHYSDGKYPINVSLDYDAYETFNSTSVVSLFDGCANKLPVYGVEWNYANEQDGIINAGYTFNDSRVDITSFYSSLDQIPTGIEFDQDTIFGQILYTNCNYDDNSFTVIFPGSLISKFSLSSNEESQRLFEWADSVCTKSFLQIKNRINFQKNTFKVNDGGGDAYLSQYANILNEINSLRSRLNSNSCLSDSERAYLNSRINYLESLLNYYAASKPIGNGNPPLIIRSSGGNNMDYLSKWFCFGCELVYSINKRSILESLLGYSTMRTNRSSRSSSDCNPDPNPNRPGNHRPNRPNDNATIDPAGFVYEGVPTNRLQGVTATCYYKETVEDMYGDQHEEVVLWDAEQYGQENPLMTDDYGYYHWDVPVGMWQVKYEKEGYETTYSDWLPVPPPQMQVNIGMVQMRQPEVIKARAYPKAVEFEFDKYMLPESLTTQNIKVVDEYGYEVSGYIELLNVELDDPLAITSIRRAPGTGLTFASKVRFNASYPFYCDEVTLKVSKRVKSYADLEMNENYEITLPIEYEMEKIVADSTINMPYGDSRELNVSVLPAYASRGKTLTVRSTSSMIATTDAEQYTLDNNGKAVITVHGDLPGMTSLVYGIDGYDLTAATIVNVMMESQMTVATPTSSILSGNEVPKGTAVYLECATEGATIYYTLDGSCPCDPTPARKVYDGNPIIINGTTNIKAMATAPDLYDSDVATFVYRVSSGIKGDVNNDGEVNIADVNAIIGIILGISTDDDIIYRADVNGDTEINIADVNEIIRIILGTSSALHFNVNCDDALHLNDVQMRPGEVRTLNVTLDNAERYSALQCDIVLPSGLTLVDVNCSNGRVSKTGVMNDSTTRVMFYSMNRHQFTSNGSPVITLTIRADATLPSYSWITLTNSVLADNQDKAWYIADCAARVSNTTGINDLTATSNRVWTEDAYLCIESNQNGVARVTTISGIMYEVPVTSDITRYELAPGIYIVTLNGISYKIAIK